MEIEQCSTESPLGQKRNKKIKDILEVNENEGTMYTKLWDTMEIMLRGKFIELSAYIKKMEKSQISNLKAHLKALEQKETDSPGGVDDRK